jgi:hypothetical protein
VFLHLGLLLMDSVLQYLANGYFLLPRLAVFRCRTSLAVFDCALDLFICYVCLKSIQESDTHQLVLDKVTNQLFVILKEKNRTSSQLHGMKATSLND